jgi:DNA polymerase-3 subunit delta'
MFDSLIGNDRAKDVLRRMLRQGRVPGALLFAGEEGLGKKLFALELARAFNCVRKVGVEGCGKCPACARIAQFEFPSSDDRDAHKKVIWSGHRDVGQLVPYSRNTLVDAVRDLNEESNYRPFEGAARVFVVAEAETLNPAASNALLKTLEEAPATTRLVLVTSRPSALLPTIRSRCQTIRFAPVPTAALEQFLAKTRKRAGEEARLAAHIAGGRPGVALGINLDAYRARRDAMLSVLEALASPRPDRARLLRAAEELGDAKNKNEYEPRLDVLEALVRDLWLLQLDPATERLVNYDLRERLARLTSAVGAADPPRWLALVEELRTQLAVNVNRRVASDALFLSMASGR